MRIPSADGTLLEGRWDLPPNPAGPAVVLCHPHPLYGGTMNVPLLRTVAARLAHRGRPVLRFNFRGVGASGGSWSGGHAEEGDVAAAAAAALAAFPQEAPALAGWSFGAVAALRWQAAVNGTVPLAAIAPPISRRLSPGLPPPEALSPGRRLFIIGDRDQFTATADLRAYAAACGADLLVLPGSDHFFFGRESRVADAVADHLAPAYA
ncbi:MAG: alpha/beta hydrolase [Acidimicrobiia bacterium]|nr:alpha/beta hydrolase [Acidimicrobiia bacterium]